MCPIHDQFNWENVRSDKDREFYLGHSVKALQGRWQKGKDVYWYTRDKQGDDRALQDELKAVKEREEQAMMEASKCTAKNFPVFFKIVRYLSAGAGHQAKGHSSTSTTNTQCC
jgi:hypothetical protein